MNMFTATVLSALLPAVFAMWGCSGPSNPAEGKTITFMDCDNVTHKVDIRLESAIYDNESGFMKVQGVVRNRMKDDRLFNVRNWVYHIDPEKGEYLKPLSVGLPKIPLKAVDSRGKSREEPFTLIYKIGPDARLSSVVLDYADQFFMTGKINRIIISLPLQVSGGKVTSRG